MDIVHKRSAENVDRLISLFGAIHAVVPEAGDRRLAPSRAALMGPGHTLLLTDLGPLDCRGAIEGGLDYDALLSSSRELHVRQRPMRVLTLEKLVELKEQWSDDESKLRARILRSALSGQTRR